MARAFHADNQPLHPSGTSSRSSGDFEPRRALSGLQPPTRPDREIAAREGRALSDALDHPSPGSALLVASYPELGVVGVVLLDARRDYFTDELHGHVAILAVAREAEGEGVGRALLKAAAEWGRAEGFWRLTLAVL